MITRVQQRTGTYNEKNGLTTIDFPNDMDITNKRIALHVLEKIPILQKYMSIPGKNRQEDPLCHLSKPIIIGIQSNK